MLHNVGPSNVPCRGRLRSGLTLTSAVFGTTYRQTRHHLTTPCVRAHTHRGTLIHAHVGSRLNRKCLSAGFPSFVAFRLASARPHQSWRTVCGKQGLCPRRSAGTTTCLPHSHVSLQVLPTVRLPLVTWGPCRRSPETSNEESQSPTWWSLEKPPLWLFTVHQAEVDGVGLKLESGAVSVASLAL